MLHDAVSLKPDYTLLFVLGLLLSYVSGFSLLVLELPKPFLHNRKNTVITKLILHFASIDHARKLSLYICRTNGLF